MSLPKNMCPCHEINTDLVSYIVELDAVYFQHGSKTILASTRVTEKTHITGLRCCFWWEGAHKTVSWTKRRWFHKHAQERSNPAITCLTNVQREHGRIPVTYASININMWIWAHLYTEWWAMSTLPITGQCQLLEVLLYIIRRALF